MAAISSTLPLSRNSSQPKSRRVGHARIGTRAVAGGVVDDGGLEDVLETAGEKDVMKHQVTASADVLQASVAVGNLKALKEEVTMHFRRINRIDKHKNSLLHICCREGFYEAVDFMLNKDNHPSRDKNVVDIETPNGSARTPLLLSFTPPHMTAAMRAPKVVAKFQDQLALADRMSVGGPTERAKLIVLLVENGAKVNVLDGQNWTPLMFACLWGWAKAVTALRQPLLMRQAQR